MLPLPVRRAELFEGPFPNEFTGLMPKVKFPPEEEPRKRSPAAKDPTPKGFGRSCEASLISRLLVGPAPKEVELKAPSSGPDTFKYCAVSPRLSNDWLKRENDGAISSAPICPAEVVFGLPPRFGCFREDES